MLTIRDTKTTPREKWRYPATDGTEIISNSFMNLRNEVAEHYRTNGRTPPTPQEIIDYLCNNVSVPCYEGREQMQNRYSDPATGGGSKNWPFALRPFKLLAKEGDKGLGSIVERVIGPIGGTAYREWFQAIFGRPCGCSERRDRLNEDYPL